MTNIHETSIISPDVKIGDNVSIGPYCNINGDVSIKDNVTLISHISISGSTTIGENTKIWPFSVIGSEPQDLKYDSEDGKLVIGANNKIREHVTMHSGTKEGGMLTEIGENNLFMVGAHIAHDCKVGNNCVFANNATLAGHVEVGDWAILGGLAAVHQWSRIGWIPWIYDVCDIATLPSSLASWTMPVFVSDFSWYFNFPNTESKVDLNKLMSFSFPMALMSSMCLQMASLRSPLVWETSTSWSRESGFMWKGGPCVIFASFRLKALGAPTVPVAALMARRMSLRSS